MNWSLSFAPFLPWPLVAGVRASSPSLLVVPGLWRRMRGAWLRAVAALALLLALANPVLTNEDREPLSTVVALVVDQSASQSLDGRDTTTAAALADAEGAARRIPQHRGAHRSRPAAPTAARRSTAPRCSGRWRPRSPTCRPSAIGAVIMLTDGQVHDIPADAAGLPPNAPLHVLLSGRDDEIDRRIVIDSAPRFGIVNEQPDDHVPRPRRRHQRHRRPCASPSPATATR